MTWARLVKFIDEEGRLCHGEPQIDQSEDLPRLLSEGNLLARELVGDSLFSALPSNNLLRVKKLVGPLSPNDVPIIRCVGLNYAEHSMSRFQPFINPAMTTPWQVSKQSFKLNLLSVSFTIFREHSSFWTPLTENSPRNW